MSTSSLVSAMPSMPPVITVCRTRTASNHPQRRLRPVTVPNSAPRKPNASPIAPAPAERGLHAGFLEEVDGVAGALFVVADELLEVAYAVETTPDPEMELRSVPDADRAVQMLADSCTAHLRHADGGEVPAVPEQRERGMVWLTFCRRTLERSLAVLETLRDDRDEDLAWAGLIELSRAPGLYRELGPAMPESRHLLELAAAVADAP